MLERVDLVALLDGPVREVGDGGVVGEVANLAALIWLGSRLARAETRGVVFYMVLFVFKIGLLIAATIYLLKVFPVDVIGFMVGITLLMPASLVASAIQPASEGTDAVEMKA